MLVREDLLSSVPSAAVRWSATVTTALALGTCLIGGTAGLGLALNQPILASYSSALPAIKANAAFGLTIAGIGLLLLAPATPRPRSQAIGRACAFFIIVLGMVTLAQYIFGVDLHVDELLIKDAPDSIGTEIPGRMAAMTAVNFVLKGWALLVLDRPRKRGLMTQAQLLSLITAIGPLTTLLSYIYGVRDVRGGGPFALVGLMAVPMALGWLALSVGTMMARPNVGIMQVLTRSSLAAYALRRLLVPTLVIPPLLVGLLYADVNQLLFIPGFGAAVFAVMAMLALVAIIWRTVAGLDVIEERKVQAEDAQRRSESDMRTLFELAPIGIAQFDPVDGRFLRVNHTLCTMTGYTESELLGMNFRSLTGADDDGKQWPEYQRIADRGGRFSFEHRYMRKDGSLLWVQVFGFIMPITEDRQRRALAIIQDLTIKKEEEHALQSAKEMAESASQMKTRFLANVSHELRTPLGAMKGFADLLLDANLSSEERRIYTSAIQRNGHILTRLIDDLLDLSKVEAGKIDLECAPVSVPELVHDVMSLLTPLAKENGIEFSASLDGMVPERIMSDSIRLRQILVNVLGNALKFTRHGYVKLTVRVQEALPQSATASLALDVEDSGPGLTEEQKTRIFKPFSQADCTTTRRYGGTGLGLVLSKRLAKALGGDVVLARSEPGRGSVFTITVATGSLIDVPMLDSLQHVVKAGMSATMGEQKHLLGKSVLLAEDAPDNQLLISKVLSSQGAMVRLAGTGVEAVRHALAGDYDVILMDLQMPEMDGIEATRRLRQSGYSRPILALTAHAMKEERERSLQAGCDDHLTKPINMDTLVQTVEHYANKQQVRPSATASW